MATKLQNGKFIEVILDSLGEGLFTVDKDFRIQTLNRAAERLIGIKREKVLGDFCKNIFRTPLCYDNCPIENVLKNHTNVFDLENEITQQSGRRIKVKLNAAVMRDEHEEPIGGVIIFRDMSHLEELHKNLYARTNFHGIIGTHKSMQEIYDLIEEVADSDSSVLIQGESGTGKELIANAIQKTSRRKDKPFIKVNCSVFPPDLLASELFGHVKGAFTDAVKDRVGRFEMADGGTIFLDEIAEMPLQMQVQLLRVLQEGTFERVGESITRKVDVRIIAATNKDVRTEMLAGRFREDLYYRLNVIPIYVPPLRERKCDIPHLVRYFIQKFSMITGKKIKEIDDEAMDLLLNYSWPGNVRELENTIEYAFARTKGQIIHASKLPPNVRMQTECYFVPHKEKSEKPLPSETSEAKLIRETLEKVKWNRSKAAKILGMGRTTLWRKMRQYGLIEA